MKKSNRIIILALSILLCLCILSTAAYADYGYTVRIFAGNQGTFSGESVIVLDGQAPGEIKFDINSVTVNDTSRYFVKGVRVSGRDNSEFTDTIRVDRDVDYVVAYGIKGSEVTFTLILKASDTGKELGRKTVYGNKGDKALIKSPYVDGYEASGHYVRIALNGDAQYELKYYPQGSEEGSATANTSSDEALNQGPAGNDSQSGGGGKIVEIIDVDLPFSSAVENSKAVNRSFIQIPAGIKIAMAVGAVIVIGFVYWLLLFYRKKKKRDNRSSV